MIRKATIDDDKVLTEISFDSKRYWNYPEDYYEIWDEELTITSEYILRNDVFLYENKGVALGYYSTIEGRTTPYLEFYFKG